MAFLQSKAICLFNHASSPNSAALLKLSRNGRAQKRLNVLVNHMTIAAAGVSKLPIQLDKITIYLFDMMMEISAST